MNPRNSIAPWLATVVLAAASPLVVAQQAQQSEPAKPAPAAKAPAKSGQAQLIDWDELLPESERASYSPDPPTPAHDYLGEGGLAAQQPLNFSSNKQLNGANVKLPGFIVPLDVGKDGIVKEFFLVPYFGACIHVPPPPPNQIVYVKSTQGIALDSIYEAYWVTGKMQVGNKTTRLGAAAYSLDADKIEIYKY